MNFDRGGVIGSAGRVNERLLSWARGHPFFALVPPKSTGRENSAGSSSAASSPPAWKPAPSGRISWPRPRPCVPSAITACRAKPGNRWPSPSWPRPRPRAGRTTSPPPPARRGGGHGEVCTGARASLVGTGPVAGGGFAVHRSMIFVPNGTGTYPAPFSKGLGQDEGGWTSNSQRIQQLDEKISGSSPT